MELSISVQFFWPWNVSIMAQSVTSHKREVEAGKVGKGFVPGLKWELFRASLVIVIQNKLLDMAAEGGGRYKRIYEWASTVCNRSHGSASRTRADHRQAASD
jgi:hypothetical protein